MRCKDLILGQQISIHALREEGDACENHRTRPECYFYPRPPRGGRHGFNVKLVVFLFISIHALREEGDAIRSIMSGI